MAKRKLRACPQCRQFIPHWHPEEIDKPFKWKKPRSVFVQSMGDLWAEKTNECEIITILGCASLNTQHTFLFLTKNPHRYFGERFTQNSWLGATTDTANHAATFSGDLSCLKYPNKFISAEPLLENIAPYLDYEAFRSIIIGALTKNGKPVPPEKGGTKREWIANIMKGASEHTIPIFIKQSCYDLYPDLPLRKELLWNVNK